jgi:hypothetical protein
MSVASDRFCEMGGRCAHYEALGQPAKLARASNDSMCGLCRERKRNAQIGKADERRTIPESQITPEVESAEQPNSSEAPATEAASEVWLRVYGSGEGTRYEGAGVVVPGARSEAAQTACGEPAVATSGYALVCRECWAGIVAGEPPRVCEPGDSDHVPAEERYEALLHAAKVLLAEGVTREEEIVPTLVWAARSWGLRQLATATKRFADAGEATAAWADLKGRFMGAVGAFEPLRVADGVLILRWAPVAVVAVVNGDTGVTEAITVEVRQRSVKPEDVALQYAKYLREKGIPEDPAGLDIRAEASNGCLRLTIRPGGDILLAGWSGQWPFSAPRYVEANYDALRGSPSKEGYGDALDGRWKGSPRKADNLIPAVVAWYMGERGRLIEQPRLRPTVARLLNEALLSPCGKQQLAEGASNSSDTVWRDAKLVDPFIRRAEHAVRETYLTLGFVLR